MTRRIATGSAARLLALTALFTAVALPAAAEPLPAVAYERGSGLVLKQRWASPGGLPMGFRFEVTRHDEPHSGAAAAERPRSWLAAGVGTTMLDHLSVSATLAQPLDRSRSRQLHVGIKLRF